MTIGVVRMQLFQLPLEDVGVEVTRRVLKGKSVPAPAECPMYQYQEPTRFRFRKFLKLLTNLRFSL